MHLFTGALAACHYIPQCREKIFTVLYKALNSENSELQEAAYECMKSVSPLASFFSKELKSKKSASDYSGGITNGKNH